MAGIAPTAPPASTSTNAGAFAAFPRVTRTRTQCLTNGAGAANLLLNHRKVSGPVVGQEWCTGFALHEGDIAKGCWTVAAYRDIRATGIASQRGIAKNEVPPRAVMYVMYHVQGIVRYRLDEWTANAGETFTGADTAIDIVNGLAMVPPPVWAGANFQANVAAAGHATPGQAAGTFVPVAAGQPLAGHVPVDITPTAAELAVIRFMLTAEFAENLASEVMALVALQLASDGHHYMPTNDAVKGLLDASINDWKALAAVLGTTEKEIQALVLHRSLHTIPAASITTWASTTASATDLRALGVEALSIRFPIDTAPGHATSARLALLKEASDAMRDVGAVVNIQEALTVLAAVDMQAYAWKDVHADAVAKLVSQTDSLAAYMAGWLSGWTAASRASVTPSSVKAYSIKRLATTNSGAWQRGVAQGESSYLAFREAGVQNVRAVDVAFVPTTDVALDAVVTAAAAAAPAIAAASRAPATLARLDAMRGAHTATVNAWQTASAVATATGNAPPAPPAALDLSAAF